VREAVPGSRSRGGGQLHVGVEDPFEPARKAHPAFRVPAAELDELAQRLESAGERIEWDDSLPGVRRFYTADPWGNRLELLAAR
jgi:catechol 2,3-dioxygenase-like lactoylglutathione lyase family enzyme